MKRLILALGMIATPGVAFASVSGFAQACCGFLACYGLSCC